MAKDFENGIWRTVGGRRIFIRDGEDLSSAMKRSGKFRTLNNRAMYDYEKTVDRSHDEQLVKDALERANGDKKEFYRIMRQEYGWTKSDADSYLESDYQGRHTTEAIQAYKNEANDKIRSVITGQSKADKGLEKYGLRVERDNSAQKEFGKRYFGKNVDVIDDRTGKRIHSSYDNYFPSDDSINAKNTEYMTKGTIHHTIKSGKYANERKNVTDKFNYYDYLKKPVRDKTGDTIGNKVAQFKEDKQYIKQHEYDIKKGKETVERYQNVQEEMKRRKRQNVERLKRRLSGNK